MLERLTTHSLVLGLWVLLALSRPLLIAAGKRRRAAE
jgi:hypothetical protein